MSLEVNNQYDFYSQVIMDPNGCPYVEETTQVGQITKCLDQYDFFKRVKLTDDGKISIVIV